MNSLLHHRLPRLLCLAFLLSLTGKLAAEKHLFETVNGQTIEAQLIGVYNNVVFLETKRGATQFIDIRGLVPESQKIALAWLKARIINAKQSPTLVKDSDSKLTQFLAKALVTNKNGTLEPYAFEDETEPEFYAFYYSAHWCGPCRRFTPKLRAFYNAMRMMGHDNFEVIFVSSDRSEKMMQQYMEEDKMPWLGVKYSKKSNTRVSKYAGSGIPCLVITDRYGRLLHHSYEGSEYLGPSVPLEKLKELLNFTAKLDRIELTNQDSNS